MKCRSCKKRIPDQHESCPFCYTPVAVPAASGTHQASPARGHYRPRAPALPRGRTGHGRGYLAVVAGLLLGAVLLAALWVTHRTTGTGPSAGAPATGTGPSAGAPATVSTTASRVYGQPTMRAFPNWGERV